MDEYAPFEDEDEIRNSIDPLHDENRSTGFFDSFWDIDGNTIESYATELEAVSPSKKKSSNY